MRRRKTCDGHRNVRHFYSRPPLAELRGIGSFRSVIAVRASVVVLGVWVLVSERLETSSGRSRYLSWSRENGLADIAASSFITPPLKGSRSFSCMFYSQPLQV